MNIASQLRTIAENTPKVYKAGQINMLENSEYTNGNVVGNGVVSLNDVTPIEHDVKVRLKSKNMLLATDFYKNQSQYSQLVEDERNCVRFIDSTAFKYEGLTFEENTQYTVSFWCKTTTRSGSGDATSRFFVFYYADGTKGMVTQKATNGEWVYLSFTSSLGKSISHIGMDSVSYMNWLYVDIDTFQLEKDTTASKYTPFVADFSNITLTRAENIGKYIFTGEEAFYLASSDFPYGFYVYDYVTDYNRTNNIQIWCTHFECVHNSEIDNENATFTFCQYNNGIWYFNYDCQKGGIVNFKEWLRQNYNNGTPVTVYYKKVDTTDEDFTYYTANADGTVEGVKSISPNMTLITDTEGININCKYYRDIDLYIDNLIINTAIV